MYRASLTGLGKQKMEDEGKYRTREPGTIKTVFITRQGQGRVFWNKLNIQSGSYAECKSTGTIPLILVQIGSVID